MAEEHGRLPLGYGGRFYGVYPALVSDINDPDGQGRVKVKLPWSPDASGGTYEAWARLATLMAGGQRGSWFIPDVEDEVLICFEAGDVRRPYVIGALWNGTDQPPESMDSDGKNYIKSITSRTGIKVTMDDTDDKVMFTIETPGGQKILMKDESNGSIEITDASKNSILTNDKGILAKDTNGNSIKLDSNGIEAKDLSNNSIKTTSSGIEVKDLNSNSIKMSASGVEIKNAMGDTLKLSNGVELKDFTGNSLKMGPANVTLKDALGNQLKFAPMGVQLQDFAGSSLKIGIPGIDLMHVTGNMFKLQPTGAMLMANSGSMIQLNPGGITMLSPTRFSLTCMQIQTTGLMAQHIAAMNQTVAAMMQVAGVVMTPSIIAGAVVSSSYTPGAGNFL